jgi:hypothetical protein
MRFTYTARRSIASGHSLASIYTLALYAQSLIPVDNPVREQNIANDGTEENLLFRIDTTWQITTDWVNDSGSAPTPMDLLREFLRSVAGGEQFTFDPTGYASDVNPQAAKLVPGTLYYQRVATNMNTYQVSFSVRMADAIL